MGEHPSGAPGWPLFAFSTVSTASSRNVSMESWSREREARLEVIMPETRPFGWGAGRVLNGVDLDFHIVSKPGVLLRPAQCPLDFAASGQRGEIGAVSGATQRAA